MFYIFYATLLGLLIIIALLALLSFIGLVAQYFLENKESLAKLIIAVMFLVPAYIIGNYIFQLNK